MALIPGVGPGDSNARPRPEASFERWISGPGIDGVVPERLRQSFGVEASDLAGGVPDAEAVEELRGLLGEAPILTARARALGTSLGARPKGESSRVVVGFDELASLLAPTRRRQTPLAWLAADEAPRRREALEPKALRRAFARLVASVLGLPDPAFEALVLAWVCTREACRGERPSMVRWIDTVLGLVDRPSAWAAPADELFELDPALRDGRVSIALQGLDPHLAPERLGERLAELDPIWTAAHREHLSTDPTPIQAGHPTPFDPEDLARLDDTFQVHLPKLFESEVGASGSSYRKSQHDVARRVAETLGADELLVVHAPTGTGKTLAYLIPAILWARRHHLRLGISTYTRALQEQAIDHDVPRALAALAPTGLSIDPDEFALLKGRANYLCWRSLVVHLPGPGDGATAWWAWTRFLGFALSDRDGDLDRMPQRTPLESLESDGVYRREMSDLMRQIRSAPGCCTRAQDRAACAAEVARARSERAHVVITNHAFVLQRREFFRHVVFDECEHLHDQALSAWSSEFDFALVRRHLGRLREPGKAIPRAPLDRLENLCPEGSAALECASDAVGCWERVRVAIEALEREARSFVQWREEQRGERQASTEHSLLREYVDGEHASNLLYVRDATQACFSHLEASLARLIELLSTVPARGVPRIRRALEMSISDLRESVEAVENWIPMVDGEARFSNTHYHDVEQARDGRLSLSTKVLLPNEQLGRWYLPELSSGAFLSATTWLRGGFEASLGYLGLDRAANPAPDEERDPSRIETFRVPSPFDYGRVLVTIPNDAPGYSQGRHTHLEYVTRFLIHVSERSRGRLLALFTNLEDARQVGERLTGHFRGSDLDVWYQGMPGVPKEELGDRFRARRESILLGVDTFWYGADFPGDTLEYLVIVKLPYGVPDRYHHAQCAALGSGPQRKRIYLPRALGKFRQGFGRLMRRVADRGVVFILDRRILQGAHRLFLRELPTRGTLEEDGTWREDGARLLSDTSDDCLRTAWTHMGLQADLQRRGQGQPFAGESDPRTPTPRARGARSDGPPSPRAVPRVEPAFEAPPQIDPDDVPF